MPKSNIATEERYDALTRAIAGGELQMVKFLWSIIEEMDTEFGSKEADLDRVRERMNSLLERFEKNPPKDGKDGKNGKDGKDGKAGRDGRDGEDGRDGRDGEDGRDGVDGKDGKRGPRGRTPKHEWKGSMLRFMQSDGEWGEWVNLRGPAGEAFGPGDNAAPQEIPIKAGDNITITRDASGAQVVHSSASGSGTGNATLVRFETPTGTVNDSNVSFTVTEIPLYIIVNGIRYYEDAGYGRSGLTITLETPVGTGGYIKSAYESDGVETPSGTVNDANTSFTVTEVPLFIVVNGQQLFENNGYTRSSLTLTLDNPVGTGGWIRSVFQDGVNTETPTGDVDDSNTEFIVENEPRYIVVNGGLLFDGAGYTYTAGTIDLTWPVGENGIINSVY